MTAWLPTSDLLPGMLVAMGGRTTESPRRAKGLLREMEESGVLQSKVIDGERNWSIVPEWLPMLERALG